MGYARRNFLVPVPSFPSFDALNAHLEERCLERMERRLRGHTETIGQRMERDLEALPTASCGALRRQRQAREPRPAPCRWCATGPTTTRCPWPTVTGRWWCAAMWARW